MKLFFLTVIVLAVGVFQFTFIWESFVDSGFVLPAHRISPTCAGTVTFRITCFAESREDQGHDCNTPRTTTTSSKDQEKASEKNSCPPTLT